jgi:hypothetical protein
MNYIVFVIFLANLAWVFKKYLSKINTIVSYIGVFIFIAFGIILLMLFNIEIARDVVLFLQFLVFLYSAFCGNLFKKPKKNFYDLTFWEAFYSVGYNVFFVGFYFFYMLISFPESLSENAKPIGDILVLAIIFGIALLDFKKKR